MRKKRIIAGIASSVLLLAVIAGVSQWQLLVDSWKLRDYQPSVAITQLAEKASFTAHGERLFYVHDPELLDKQAFSGKCDQDEQTIVLGCYISDSKIYIFDVEDERLRGVEEVTAAHEMLHAAYDRLSRAERERIDELTEQVFIESDDERLQRSIANYANRDASVVANELHSILATEVRVLPAELEEYYTRYFINRFAVVTMAEQYEQEFTKLEDQIRSYDEQLEALDAAISVAQTDLELLESALDTERVLLEGMRSDPAAYNAQVSLYNEKVRAYNAQLQALRGQIDQYNELVATRNAIATEERNLQKALDSRPVIE